MEACGWEQITGISGWSRCMHNPCQAFWYALEPPFLLRPLHVLVDAPGVVISIVLISTS